MHPDEKKKDYYEKRIAKLAGKAINDYTMIREKDRVLVAVSGGKDSLSLLHILSIRKKWLPIDYNLQAIHVKMNSPCLSESNIQTIQNLCEELKVKLHIREAFVPETEKSKCFFCSWNRRKSFFRACEELDCNILALGHHKDDIIETLLLNLFYHGEISTMPPKLDFFKGALTLVRPLSYIEEYQTKKYAKEMIRRMPEDA